MANTPPALQALYDKAYAMYTERYTHTDDEDGELITYRPMSICSHREMDEIFSQCDNWDDILKLMRESIGKPGLRGK